MKTSGALTSSIVLCIAVFAGCTQDSAKKKLATDLRDYVAQMQKWETREKTVYTALDEVESSQYVDDDFVIRQLRGALPDVEEHIRELGAYEPRTDSLTEVHAHYRQGWEELRAGFGAVINAMEAKDYVRLASAKNRLEVARRELLRTFQTLDALLQENEEELKTLQPS